MADISFKQIIDITGQVSKDFIQYTDSQGTIWTMPMGTGHRFEEIYDEWVAAGNTILPPDQPPTKE